MKNIVLARIDDRLIHGQVVTQWLKSTHGNRILIIDDALLKNKMMLRVLKAAAPPGVIVDVLSEADAVQYLKGEPQKDESIVILVKVPGVFENLINNGITISKIILGGMGIGAGRRKFNKNVAATEMEVDSMKRILDKGTHIYYQLVPSDKAADIKNLF